MRWRLSEDDCKGMKYWVAALEKDEEEYKTTKDRLEGLEKENRRIFDALKCIGNAIDGIREKMMSDYILAREQYKKAYHGKSDVQQVLWHEKDMVRIAEVYHMFYGISITDAIMDTHTMAGKEGGKSQ